MDPKGESSGRRKLLLRLYSLVKQLVRSRGCWIIFLLLLFVVLDIFANKQGFLIQGHKLADYYSSRVRIRFYTRTDGVFFLHSKEETPVDNRLQEMPDKMPSKDDEGKDILLVFEKKEDMHFYWPPPEVNNVYPSYKWRVIPCNHYGIKSCTVSADTSHLEKANAIVHLTGFVPERALTVPKRDDQAFIGFFTEADDGGCHNKQFDAKQSYSPDATIKHNDNCEFVKAIYPCMKKAIRIRNSQQDLTVAEANRLKKNLYRYCLKNRDHDDETTLENARNMVWKYKADVGIFVSNCNAAKRVKFMDKFLFRHPYRLTVHSVGRCRRNYSGASNKMGGEYKFIFAMENKMKRNYVTEKIYQPLATGVIPIYQGAPNIFEYAPRGSFVGVHSFATPKEVADYVEYLSRNETAYDEFFNWDLEQWEFLDHTTQCMQIEAHHSLDASWCSVCDWVANIFPQSSKRGFKNCDKNEFTPYFGYPRDPGKFRRMHAK